MKNEEKKEMVRDENTGLFPIPKRGSVYGKLTAQSRSETKYRGQYLWLCRCECGQERNTFQLWLRNGKANGCKECQVHISTKKGQPTIGPGERFGNLEVVRRTTKKIGMNYLWLCKCDCGGEREVMQGHLRVGSVTMCEECKAKERRERGVSEENSAELREARKAERKRISDWEYAQDRAYEEYKSSEERYEEVSKRNSE